jgi:hypothetical protein
MPMVPRVSEKQSFVVSSPPPENYWRKTCVSVLPNGQRGLVAAEDVPIGTPVARFEGPIVNWRDVPPAEVCYALLLQDDDWLLPRTDARYINHSCAPNCRVDDTLSVVTIRAIATGEQFTLSYDTLAMAEYLQAPQHYFWDSRWSFDCCCGEPGCVGRIDRYRIRSYDDPEPLTPGAKIRLGAAPGKGRGVFATAPIARGEIIERAPVLVSPADEWSHVEKTVLYHYCFAWGPQLEHAAIGLGYASLYNHSYTPNAVYLRHLEDLLIHFVALHDIAPGEQITVNYNNDPANQEPVWFEVI